MVGGAVAVGPLVGGVVTEGLGWEWIFFVNVPIGIVAMVLTERKIVNVFAKQPEPVDVPGLLTFSAAGIGIGTTNPGIGQAAIAVVPVEKSGMGSRINTTFRQVGIATGVAGLGAVFQARVDSKLHELVPHAPAGLGEAVASGGSRAVAELPLPPALHEKAVHAADVAFVSGLNTIILIAAIVSFLGAAAGFALTRSRDFVQPTGG